MMFRVTRAVPPHGQAFIESLVFVGAAAMLLALSQWLLRQAEVSRQSSLAAGFQVQRCAVSSAFCSGSENASGYSGLLQSPYGAVQSLPSLSRPSSSAQSGPVASTALGLRGFSDQYRVDQPVADAAGTRRLDQISGAMWRFTQQTASSLFGLPDAQRLVRVEAELSLPQAPGLKARSRVALAGQDWAASGSSAILARVSRGATPSAPLQQVVTTAYMPVTHVLMPGLDAIGLESGSALFRSQFHRQTQLRPFPGTTPGP